VHEDNQRPDQAEAVLRSAMERIPDHPGIVYRLGMLLIQHKKDDEGHRMLLKAAEMSLFDPGLAFIVGGRGRALENARKPREAEAAYRQALRVDPEYAEGHYMLASFLLRQNRIEEAQIELNQGIRSETLSETLVQAFRMLQARINERAAATTGKK
jgi:tetratricopeptide (TPR) repeat protein